MPLRVEVLDEKLVAFRDTDGRVGLMDEYCPHRGAPMFFGRNEESGLRCIYRGWKFDVDGVCTDIPNAPEGEVFRHKIQVRSYPCVDAGDLIWAYMGPKDKQPPFPEFEWTKLPAEHRYVTKFLVECNYLQAMEGDYDPGHAPFLHTKMDGSLQIQQAQQFGVQLRPTNRPVPENEPFPVAVGPRRQTEADREAWGTIEDTDSGMFFLRSGEQPDGTKIASLSPWMMPIYCTAGTTAGTNTMSANIRVPINNTQIWFYRLRWNYDPIPEAESEEYKHGGWFYPELIPGTYVGVQNVHNDYKIDRQVQKNFTYSGIPCFPWQDIAMMEDQWGPIAALAAGTEPSEPWHPEAYRYHIASVSTQEGTLDEAIAKVKAMAGETPAAAEALKIPVEVD